jgi:hypothetical protein
MVCHYLTDPDSWFLVAGKGDHDINFFTRQPIRFQNGDDFDTVMPAQGLQRFSAGAGEWRGPLGLDRSIAWLDSGNSYPRQITNYGSTRSHICLACRVSLRQASDVLRRMPGIFGSTLTDRSQTPCWGVNEVSNAPASGVALGAAVANSPFDAAGADAITMFGSKRVSSTAAVVSSDKPALGLMWGSGANVSYLFVVGATGQLRIGSEAEWLAGTGTLLATKAPSGKLDMRREGRGVIGGNDRAIALNAASIISGVEGQRSRWLRRPGACGSVSYHRWCHTDMLAGWGRWRVWTNS